MIASHDVVCAYCHRSAKLTQPGRFCTSQHRAYFHRDALRARRQQLATQAESAIASGDVGELERVARAAAALLNK